MRHKLADWYDKYRDWRTPDIVEPANRRERWKRTAWEISSTLLAFAVALSVAATVIFALEWAPISRTSLTGIRGVLFAFATVGFAVALDALWLFPWGVDRFGIVEPWEFRDARAKERDER